MAEIRRIYQNVTSSYIYQSSSHPKNSFTRVLTLGCGHQLARKGSQAIPVRARCLECESVASAMGDGARAYRDSKALDENPYSHGETSRAWATGWRGAQRYVYNINAGVQIDE